MKMRGERNAEIEGVKRLLILLLLKLGATSQELGAALGIDSSGIRKLMNVRKVKKVEFIR
jgi:hypothetical protein